MRSSNPCGNAHFRNKPCRLCDEARRKSAQEIVDEPNLTPYMAGAPLTLEKVREQARIRKKRWRKKVLSDPERAELLREADRLRKRRKRGSG